MIGADGPPAALAKSVWNGLEVLGIPWWVFALLGAGILAMFGVMVYFKRFTKDEPPGDDTNVDLEKLYQAYDAGLMTKEEYRRVRRALLGDLVPSDVGGPADEPPADEADDSPDDPAAEKPAT